MTKHKKIFWQIFPSNLLILILTVICFAWFGKVSIESFFVVEQEKGLAARAYLIRPLITAMFWQKNIEEMRSYCVESGRESKTRITVIKKGGKVLADSNEDSDIMESHHNREEIVEAMRGELGSSIRFSRTLGQSMLYVAVPLFAEQKSTSAFREGEIGGVLRMSVPVASIERAIWRVSLRLFLGIAVLTLFAVVASMLVSRNISKPIETIKQYAEKISRGDLSQRMSLFQGSTASLEVESLASVLDKMATQLNERIETVRNQRNELEAVFSSMVESVIAVDRDEKVININRAAARLLGIEREDAKGKIVQEVLRNLNLQKQIQQVFTTGISLEDEILHVDDEGEKYLQTNIVSLSDEKRKEQGVLVVLNDVTKLRRLENVRRDFVANVSHELRTPITSIRGYVETLLDGAIDNRDDAMQFLDIVLRQAERLNEIIEDLLALSRIEQEADHGLIQLDTGSVCVVIDVAVETCQLKAEQFGVTISVQCDKEIELQMNATLIEQALVNLLVNAIRYSRKGGEVKVVAANFAEGDKKGVRIDVIDTGVGIAANHLPRLFERFYRSDKARSRKQGGTGLGLAIVKHIALAHNGRVEVQSEVGKGSTFSIFLPR